MKNLFEISPEEKDRIRGLHEGYKTVHGTTSLLNEQTTDRTIQGTLLDFDTKEPLVGGSIFINERKGDKSAGTTADSEGKFKLEGIKPGETLTMSFVGYTSNVVNDNIIDIKNGVDEKYFLKPGIQTGEVVIKAEREKFVGCMDPEAKNYDPKAWIDCKGKEFKDAKYSVKDGESNIELPTVGDYDTSCCEYYEGCHEEDAANYYKKDKELVKLEEEGKTIKACKKCCKKSTQGCKDARALNYDPNLDKGCEDTNNDGSPDCCNYAKDQRGVVETTRKNFQQYYGDRLISSVINLYSNEKGRNERDIKKLVGNHKINNAVPQFIRSSDGNHIGFIIPLQADTEAIRKLKEKISSTRNPKKKEKLKQKLKEVSSNNVEIVVRFGRNLKDILTFQNYKDGPEIYLRPKGSEKRGKRVYVGPTEFNQVALTKRLVPFLQALNKARDLVPQTDSNFDE